MPQETHVKTEQMSHPTYTLTPNSPTGLTGLIPAQPSRVNMDDRSQHPVVDLHHVEPDRKNIAADVTSHEPTVVNNYSNCTFGSKGDKPYTRNRPKMPVFNDREIDIEAYLANFNAMTRNWPPEEKLSLLREKLTGAAGKVLAALDLQGGPVTFDSVVRALEKHYIGERSEWVAKLRDIRRNHDESLDDLAFRLTLYSQRAYGKLQPDLGLQLYLALRDGPLGDRLFDWKDKPLEEVLQRAKSFEAHLLATNQPVFDRSGNQLEVSAVGGDNGRSDGVPRRGTYSRGRGRGRGNFSNRGRGGQQRYQWHDRRLSNGDRVCNICGAADHLWRQCEVGKSHFTPPNPDNQPLNLETVPPQ